MVTNQPGEEERPLQVQIARCGKDEENVDYR